MVNEKNSKLSIWKICAAGTFLTVAINSNAKAGEENLNIDQVKQGLESHRRIIKPISMPTIGSKFERK